MKCHITSSQGCLPSIRLTIVAVNFGHLAEVAFVRFLHCSYSFSASSYYPLWKEATVLSHTDGGVTLYLLKNPATWMDFEISMLSAVSPTEKDKCQMISLICGIFKKKKKDTNELICKTEIDLRYRRQIYDFQRGKG